MSFLSVLAQHALSVLIPVATGVVTAFVGQGVAWLRSRTNGTKVADTMVLLTDLVQDAVLAVEQSINHAVRDDFGRLSEATAQKAKEEALRRLRANMGPEQYNIIAKRLGLDEQRLTLLLGDKIESAVFGMKLNKARAMQQTDPAGLPPFLTASGAAARSVATQTQMSPPTAVAAQ